MSRRLLDYNPLSGTHIWFQYDNHSDQMTITHEQDVSKLLDITHALAVDEDRTKKGMKDDWWHYATIPEVVQVEMLQKHGVDIGNKNHRKRFFELLNTEYKWLKTTHKTHNVRS